MSVQRIATRYAKSILDLALEQGNLETVLEDMKGLLEMSKHRELLLLFKSPIVSLDKKRAVFKSLFDPNFSALTTAFIHLVLTKRREELLPEIAEEFVTQYKLFKGITNVTITTATPLNEAALAEIKAKLLASDITAKELEITQKVNPELLGGFVIEVGDKLFDNSISFKLNKLSKQFKSKDFIKAI
ncbi:MAG: ATP synthase F1 subunit delta [Saprospiraceae bacterium]|nr:ATP synthase F1 subunit delta [Saprospiraceae bacterium]